jgi:hypothetical protein
MARQSKAEQIYNTLTAAARERLAELGEGYANRRGAFPMALVEHGLVTEARDDVTARGRQVLAVHAKAQEA